MIHPSTTLQHVSDTIGDGVFATSDIPRGTIVYVIDPLDVKLSPREFQQLEDPVRELADKYSYIDHRGYRILSWDLAKYVNHSCDPNTISTGYGFEIALRDIAEGEQITDDYGLFNLEWTVACSCGSANCRKRIQGSDLDRYAECWDQWVKDALAHVRRAEQPLWNVMAPATREALSGYLDGSRAYRSVRALRWSGLTAVPAGLRARGSR